MSTLTEVWREPSNYTTVRQDLIVRAKQKLESELLTIGEGVTGTGIWIEHEGHTKSVGVLASRLVKPHVDPDFPEWSALWIIQAAGHVLGIADHRPSNPPMAGRKPLKSPGLTSVPLQVGQIVLFNAHRTHWMDRSADRSLLFAASFDFQTRPTQQQVHERIRIDLRGRFT